MKSIAEALEFLEDCKVRDFSRDQIERLQAITGTVVGTRERLDKSLSSSIDNLPVEVSEQLKKKKGNLVAANIQSIDSKHHAAIASILMNQEEYYVLAVHHKKFSPGSIDLEDLEHKAEVKGAGRLIRHLLRK